MVIMYVVFSWTLKRHLIQSIIKLFVKNLIIMVYVVTLHKLIQSYLGNRRQFVSINGFESEIKTLSCGVLQDSSLGPLLFLVYINDLRLCLVLIRPSQVIFPMILFSCIIG